MVYTAELNRWTIGPLMSSCALFDALKPVESTQNSCNWTLSADKMIASSRVTKSIRLGITWELSVRNQVPVLVGHHCLKLVV